MARRKCLVCGRMIDIEKESYQEYKNRVVHPDCFRSLTKEINVTAKKKKAAKTETKTKTKPKIEEVKDCVSEEEFKAKKSYYDYLKSLLGKDTLPTKVYVLSKNYIEQYNFDWSGMEKALRYFYEIKNNAINGDAVGIIPYCYEDAEQYFLNKEDIEKANEKTIKEVNSFYKLKTIKIDPLKTNKSRRKEIDLSSIGN